MAPGVHRQLDTLPEEEAPQNTSMAQPIPATFQSQRWDHHQEPLSPTFPNSTAVDHQSPSSPDVQLVPPPPAPVAIPRPAVNPLQCRDCGKICFSFQELQVHGGRIGRCRVCHRRVPERCVVGHFHICHAFTNIQNKHPRDVLCRWSCGYVNEDPQELRFHHTQIDHYRCTACPLRTGVTVFAGCRMHAITRCQKHIEEDHPGENGLLPFNCKTGQSESAPPGVVQPQQPQVPIQPQPTQDQPVQHQPVQQQPIQQQPLQQQPVQQQPVQHQPVQQHGQFLPQGTHQDVPLPEPQSPQVLDHQSDCQLACWPNHGPDYHLGQSLIQSPFQPFLPEDPLASQFPDFDLQYEPSYQPVQRPSVQSSQLLGYRPESFTHGSLHGNQEHTHHEYPPLAPELDPHLNYPTVQQSSPYTGSMVVNDEQSQNLHDEQSTNVFPGNYSPNDDHNDFDVDAIMSQNILPELASNDSAQYLGMVTATASTSTLSLQDPTSSPGALEAEVFSMNDVYGEYPEFIDWGDDSDTGGC